MACVRFQDRPVSLLPVSATKPKDAAVSLTISSTPGLPFIGRVHDIPTEGTWLKFYEWSKMYGPIYQMEMFGSVHVWISSERIAQDLLSRRGQIYSDRPVIPNLSDNRTSGDYLALLGQTGKLCPRAQTTEHVSLRADQI
jgi:hypothetical protein